MSNYKKPHIIILCGTKIDTITSCGCWDVEPCDDCPLYELNREKPKRVYQDGFIWCKIDGKVCYYDKKWIPYSGA